MRYKRPESVLVLVYTAQYDVLLLNRVSPPGFWQSVTGSLEEHELPHQAACRELLEETGLYDVRIDSCNWQNRFAISAQWRQRYAPHVTHNTEHVFVCALTQRPVQIRIAANEHSEYQWVALPQAIEKVSSSTNRDALKRFIPRC